MKAPPVSLEDPWPSQRNKPKNLHFSTPFAPEPWIVEINITESVPLVPGHHEDSGKADSHHLSSYVFM